MPDLRLFASTSNIVRFILKDKTTGQNKTGLSLSTSGLIISTITDNEAAATAYTQAGSTVETITTLGTFAAPTATKCRFKEVDATNHKGLYEFQFANARFAVTSAKRLVISVNDGESTILDVDYEIELTQFDPFDSVRLGMTALPNANANANGGLPILSVSGTTLGYTISTLTTYTGNTVQTGDSFARIGLAGVGLTNLGDTRIANLDATITSRLAPTVAARTLDVSAGGEAGVDWANVGSPTTTLALTGTTISTSQRVLANVVRTSTAQSGSSITITLDSGASATTDLYKGMLVFITSGTGAGQARTIITYGGSTKSALLDRAWVTNPDNTSVFVVVAVDNPALTSSLSVTAAISKVAILSGTGQAGSTSNTIKLASSASTTNNIYNGDLVTITGGTGVGQTRTIISYVGSTKVATVDKAWNTIPDSTSTFDIYASTTPSVFSDQGVLQAATTSTATLATTASSTSSVYNGSLLTILSGTDAGDTAEITAYNGSTKVATISGTFAVTPDTTSAYAVIPTDSGTGVIGGTQDVNVVSWGSTSVSTNVAGVPKVDVVDWLGSAPLALSSQQVQAVVPSTQKVDIETIKTNPVVNAGTVTFPTGATLASTTNITAGTITTVTNVTTVNGLAAGVITSASFAAGAINAAALASDADAEIAAAVWDLAVSGHTTSGSFGAAVNAAGSVGDPWSTSLPGSYGFGTAGFLVGTYLDAAMSSRTKPADTQAAVTVVGSVTGAVGSVTGNVGGSVASVAAGVTVTTNNDKTGYSLTVAPPTAAAIATAIFTDTTASDFTTAGSPGKVLVAQLGGAFTTTSSSVFTTAALANAPGISGDVTVGSLTAAALAQLFTTDTTKVYADAVSGSVVKEIGSNAGGGSVTVGGYAAGQDPATLVLDVAASLHNVANSVGAKINTTANVLNQLSGASITLISPVVAGGDTYVAAGDDYYAADGRALSYVNTAGTWPDLTAATVTLVTSPDGGHAGQTLSMTVVTPTGPNQTVRAEPTAAQTTASLVGQTLIRFPLPSTSVDVSGYRYPFRIVAVLADGHKTTLVVANWHAY